MPAVLDIILVVVEDSQVQKETEDRHISQQRPHVIVHRLAGVEEGVSEELIGGIEAENQDTVGQHGETLGQIGAQPRGPADGGCG